MSSNRPMQNGFSGNGDSAITSPSESSGSVPAAPVSHGSHAMTTYATEAPSAGGVRTVALPSSQPRPDAEAVREAQMRMQMQLDNIMRQFNPRQP